MSNEQLRRTVTSWLIDDDITPPDSQQSARQVAARLPKVRQQGRWWPLPLLRRSPAPPPTIPDTIDHQPLAIPATNGHTPTVIGSTTSMLSPVKAITAGALVFAIGGAFLIAQPFGQGGNTAPGAKTDTAAVPATWVTGEYVPAPTCVEPTSEVDGVVHHMWGNDCDPQSWTTSDPRLTGEAAALWNADVYEPDAYAYRGDPGSNISIITRAYHVRTEAGGWACRSNHLAHGYGWYPQAETGETAICAGEGEYDGLSAILVLDGPAGPQSIVGLILPGDAPPLPEPAAQ